MPRLIELGYQSEDGWIPPEKGFPRMGSGLVLHEHALERPGSWRRELAGSPHQVWVSSDRVLLTTRTLEYHSWGYLGPALLLDLESGESLAELRGESGAALPGGRFLLGLEGYDLFDTWLHDRDGSLLGQWRSCGHYVVEGEDVRVVECDRNSPTSSRVKRLFLDGSMEEGPALVDGQVPAPVLLADGTMVVLDAGILRGVDRQLRDIALAELPAISESEAWRFFGELALREDRLSVRLVERSPDAPLVYHTHLWTFLVEH